MGDPVCCGEPLFEDPLGGGRGGCVCRLIDCLRLGGAGGVSSDAVGGMGEEWICGGGGIPDGDWGLGTVKGGERVGGGGEKMGGGERGAAGGTAGRG